MNSLFLLLITVTLFIFGYRFFSKLLSVWVFRLDYNYSTPSQIQAEEIEYTAGNRYLVFGYYIASLGSVATVIGTGVAVIWGWIPAFLWLTVAGTVVAGIYGLSGLWLSLRHPGANAVVVVATLFGNRARDAFSLLIFLPLLLVNAVFAVLTAALLTDFPTAVLPFWLQIPIALGLGLFLHKRAAFEIIPATLMALLAAAVLIYLGGKIPVIFHGSLDLQILDTPVFSLAAAIVWLLLIFLYLSYTAHLPVGKFARARGYLAALQLGLMLLVTIIGILALHPPIVAPNFNYPEHAPTALPWLFAVLAGGAIAGIYALASGNVAAKQMTHETDARPLGYGAALFDAAVGLSALIIYTTGFANPQAWKQHYIAWQAQTPAQILGNYINGVSYFAASLGWDAQTAVTMAAVIVTTLAATALEAGVRFQKTLWLEMKAQPAAARSERGLFILTFIIALALSLDVTDQGITLWPLLGCAGLICTGLILLLTCAVLRRLNRPVMFILAPAVLLLAVANWALVSQFILAWTQERWLILAGDLLLFLLQIGLLIAGWLGAKNARNAARQLDSAPL